MKSLKRLLLPFTFLVGVGLWYACEDEGREGGADHNVGNDCLMCHKAGGAGEGIFGAGGTVFKVGTTIGATGASVKLYTNADGSGSPVVTMTSEVGGNFFTKSTINFGTGLYVKVSSANGTSSMMSPIPTGACNSCHGISTGKITVQ